MKLHEYIIKAKEELDKMYLRYLKEHDKHPDMWLLEMNKGEWGEQELAERFN